MSQENNPEVSRRDSMESINRHLAAQNLRDPVGVPGRDELQRQERLPPGYTPPVRVRQPQEQEPQVGDTVTRARNMQARLGVRAPKQKIRTASALFGSYKPSGAVVKLAENKISIMPGLTACLEEIAVEAGVNLADEDQSSLFLEALVTDVYTNPYSDKSNFEGNVVVGENNEFTMPRVAIKIPIEKRVGTMHRRFARAMAPLIVEVMTGTDSFNELLDRRCTELNLSTRAEAIKQFDGNEGLPIVDRQGSQRAAEAKHLALSMRSTHRSYAMDNSAKAMGLHGDQPTLVHDHA